jgi:hypothetical protein
MIYYKKLIQPIIILILLIIIFFQRSCFKDDNKISYNTKIVKQFDTIHKPISLPSKIITQYKTSKGDTVFINGKVDTVIVKQFEVSNDSVKTQMFIDATKIRQYKNEFNDSIADVSIFTETKGELLKIAPTITIKARLPEKKTVFALYGGFETFNNLQLNNFGTKGNIFFQNKRGDLFSTGYDTNSNIYLGYSFRFINIKK